MAALRPAHPETVARHEQRSEKRESLVVVPMRVTEKDVGLHQMRHVFHPMQSEEPRPGTAIENQLRARFCFHFHTGGVAAKPVSTRAGRSDRSSSTPKTYSHSAGLQFAGNPIPYHYAQTCLPGCHV